MQHLRTIVMPLRITGCMILLLLSICSNSFGRTYYSRQSGLWSVSGTWSTVGYGNPTNTGTFPQRGDIVFIGDGHNIVMNINSITASITVGQGTSGTLMYSNFLNFLMVIAGDLTVNSGATFGYASNSSRMHNCFIGGNLTNNGRVDLYADANDYVNLTFNTRINSVVSGTGTWDLNTVTLFKSTLRSYRLEATTLAFETAIRNLQITYGTFMHNNTGTYLVNPAAGNLTVGPDAIIEVRNGILHLSPSGNSLLLQGELAVSGGTMRVGATTGLEGVRYDQNGTQIPGITVTSGTLQVYGGITCSTSSLTDPFRFSLSGGVVILNTGSTGTGASLFKINNHSSSRCTMSAGTLTLQKPNTSGPSVADFDLCGSAGVVTLTGGTLFFGNNNTANNSVFTFNPYPGATMPDTRVSGLISRIVTLAPVAGASANYRFKSLYIDLNKVFDNRSASGTGADSKTMTLTGTYDGVRAFYNAGTFMPRTGTVVIGGTAPQRIDGNVSTTFYGVTVNNAAGCELGITTNVSNLLTMSNGILTTNSSTPLVCLPNGNANLGSSVSYVNGPMQKQVASTSLQTFNFPIGKGGCHRPVSMAVLHSSTANVTYTSEMHNVSARGMAYSLPATLGWVSDIRYFNITRSAVSNLSNAQITLSYGADDIVTDPSFLRIARDNGGPTWVDLGGSGTASGSGTITSGNFTKFDRFFTIANGAGGSNPLPVEFLNFDAAAVNGKTKIDWSTLSETNSDYFEVQRSTDGISFSPVGIVKAAGFATSLRKYNFTDTQPATGHNYYRLRQVDRNGQFALTGIKGIFIYKVRMAVFPNPVSGNTLRINFPNGSTAVVSGTLLDLNGKMIAPLRLNGFDGMENTFTLPDNVPAGTYVISVTDETGGRWQEKLIVSL